MIPKGSGSENGSFLQMLIPADGVKAIKRFVIDKVIECGGRVCPPTIVGVGIGGTSDLCMHIAKVAATRPLGTTCSDPEGAKIEAELSEAVNELGIGPQGLGGRSTSFRVHVEVAATHITMNPVAREHPVPLGAPRQRGHHAGGIDFNEVMDVGRRDLSGDRPPRGGVQGAMTHHILETPVTEAQVRALKIGDTVTLEKTLFGVRDANLIAMFDKGRKTIFDMKGHAVVHTAPNVRKVPVTNECPSGYEAMCVGTTTSQRMERFTRPLMEREGVRIIIGKGGMGQGTLDAFRDIGGAYLAVIGGAAALQTTWIESIEEVDMDDLNPGKHLALPHQGLRPAAGDDGFARRLDLRARVQGDAKAKRDAILASIGAVG